MEQELERQEKIMSGVQRREEILQLIRHDREPVSGTALAKHFGVSRQVIVQDIALLRAQSHEILSTNRGYICSGAPGAAGYCLPAIRMKKFYRNCMRWWILAGPLRMCL